MFRFRQYLLYLCIAWVIYCTSTDFGLNSCGICKLTHAEKPRRGRRPYPLSKHPVDGLLVRRRCQRTPVKHCSAFVDLFYISLPLSPPLSLPSLSLSPLSLSPPSLSPPPLSLFLSVSLSVSLCLSFSLSLSLSLSVSLSLSIAMSQIVYINVAESVESAGARLSTPQDAHVTDLPAFALPKAPRFRSTNIYSLNNAFCILWRGPRNSPNTSQTIISRSEDLCNPLHLSLVTHCISLVLRKVAAPTT